MAITAHAIAISLGALKAPDAEGEPAAQSQAPSDPLNGRPVPIQTAEELADFDDPAVQKFLHQLGAALG